MLESWRTVKRIEQDIDKKTKPGIFNTDYWINTRKIDNDREIGKDRQKKRKDERLGTN